MQEATISEGPAFLASLLPNRTTEAPPLKNGILHTADRSKRAEDGRIGGKRPEKVETRVMDHYIDPK